MTSIQRAMLSCKLSEEVTQCPNLYMHLATGYPRVAGLGKEIGKGEPIHWGPGLGRMGWGQKRKRNQHIQKLLRR